MPLPVAQMNEKERTAFKMREQGATFAEIGLALGVSRSQANILFRIADRKAGLSEFAPPHGAQMFLSRRTVNHLELCLGVDAFAHDAPLKISGLSARDILNAANLGRRAVQEIAAWLEHNGLSLKGQPNEKTSTRCPHCGGKSR